MNQPTDGTTGRHFPALGYRDFRILWLGMLFSSGTMAFQYYAQMWIVYELTDAIWVLGMLGGMRGLAVLIFGLYGGALADRLDRRKLLFITQSVAFLCNLAIGLLVIAGMINFPIFFLLIFLGSANASIDGPIRQALIPELVGQRHIPNAVALNTAAGMGSFALTPILAGLVIEWVGTGGAYLVSTLGNLVVILALTLLRYRGEVLAAAREPVLTTIREGVRYGRRNNLVFWIIVLNFVIAAFGFSLFMGPILEWVANVLGLTPARYGLLAATWGVGTLVASVYLSYVATINRPGRMFILGGFLFALSFTAFGMVRYLPLVGFFYVINGAAWTVASIASTAVIQSIVPNEVRGRIMSLMMISGAIAQMNALLLGYLADLWTIELLLPGSTLLCATLIAVLAIFVRSLRHLDRLILEERGEEIS